MRTMKFHGLKKKFTTSSSSEKTTTKGNSGNTGILPAQCWALTKSSRQNSTQSETNFQKIFWKRTWNHVPLTQCAVFMLFFELESLKTISLEGILMSCCYILKDSALLSCRHCLCKTCLQNCLAKKDNMWCPLRERSKSFRGSFQSPHRQAYTLLSEPPAASVCHLSRLKNTFNTDSDLLMKLQKNHRKKAQAHTQTHSGETESFMSSKKKLWPNRGTYQGPRPTHREAG